MQTKQSDNVLVTSSQPLKKTKGVMPSIRKLLLLYPFLLRLPAPGFKPLKQVHLYTKWRKFVPQHYKDETCPLPPNSIISKVQKPKQKKNTDEDSDCEILFQQSTTNNSVADIVRRNQGSAQNDMRRAPKRKKAKLVEQTAIINVVERFTDNIPSDVSQWETDSYKSGSSSQEATVHNSQNESEENRTDINLLGENIPYLDSNEYNNVLHENLCQIKDKDDEKQHKVQNNRFVDDVVQLQTQTQESKNDTSSDDSPTLKVDRNIRGKRLSKLLSSQSKEKSEKQSTNIRTKRNIDINPKRKIQPTVKRVTRRSIKESLPPSKRTRSQR